MSGPVNGVGTITADGGTLEFTGAVDSTSASSFHIANVAGSVLKFDGAVGTTSIHPTITFDGGLGVLDLSSVTLANFHAVVANFTSGEGIKVAGAADVVLDRIWHVHHGLRRCPQFSWHHQSVRVVYRQ